MGVISFPDTVDEISARLVATGVVIMTVAAVVVDEHWLLVPLTYGFWARVLTGPKLSPLALLVTRVLRPALSIPPRPVAGSPKRFAQGIGAGFTTTALILWLTHHWGAAQIVLVLLVGAAVLEAALGLCLGCKIYGACVVPIRKHEPGPETRHNELSTLRHSAQKRGQVSDVP